MKSPLARFLGWILAWALIALGGLVPCKAEVGPNPVPVPVPGAVPDAEPVVTSAEDLLTPLIPPPPINPAGAVREAAANTILTSLVVAIITYSLALVHAFGVLYFGEWTRRILQFTLSTLMCVSPMVLLLVIYAAKDNVGLLIVLFLAISVYPLTARLLLTRIFDAAPDFHFLQAKILGHGPAGVFIDYAWPRFLPLTLPFFFLGFIYSLLMESMFSSLGLVSLPNGATWGSLIHQGLDELLDNPWAVFSPGIAIMGTALTAYACIPVFDRLLAVPRELN
jgi:ABC-type antimicrobial peptide transport system permease subunit